MHRPFYYDLQPAFKLMMLDERHQFEWPPGNSFGPSAQGVITGNVQITLAKRYIGDQIGSSETAQVINFIIPASWHSRL
jgi:hypothetical protein